MVRGQGSLNDPAFHRLGLLVGQGALKILRDTRAILFGVGGVGGWAAEALVRSGVGHLTLVDSDVVCITNINRQPMATTSSVGCSKVEELASRLRIIHPRVQVETVQAVYEPATRHLFDLSSFDVVLDAIDSYTSKIELIRHATEGGTRLFSSMGASARLDGTLVRTGSVWTASMDPFAKILRKGLRRCGYIGDFDVVYSLEPPMDPTERTSVACGTHRCFCPHLEEEHRDWCASKLVINGSAMHVTAAFGMALAGLVVRDAHRRASISSKDASVTA